MQGILSSMILKPYYQYPPEDLDFFRKPNRFIQTSQYNSLQSPQPKSNKQYHQQTIETENSIPSNQYNFSQGNEQEAKEYSKMVKDQIEAIEEFGNEEEQVGVTDFEVNKEFEVDLQPEIGQLGDAIEKVEIRVKNLGRIVQGTQQQSLLRVQQKKDDGQRIQNMPNFEKEQDQKPRLDRKYSYLGFFKSRIKEKPKRFNLKKFQQKLNYKLYSKFHTQ